MKTNNDFTKFLLVMGMFLAVFAIARFDTKNFSFENNERSYLMIIFSIVFLIIAFLRIKNEKNS